MPFPPETSGPTFPPVGPQVAQVLFDRPSPARLQVQGFQTSEHLPVTLRQVLLREQPKILGAFKGVIAFRLQTAVFCLTPFIDRLGHVLHDVVAVVDDLAIRNVMSFFDQLRALLDRSVRERMPVPFAQSDDPKGFHHIAHPPSTQRFCPVM